jgi:hypothetical protein
MKKKEETNEMEITKAVQRINEIRVGSLKR